MKNACAAVVLMLFFVAFCTAQTQKSRRLDVTPEQVQRVEILYFPERILVRADIRPESLEKLYQYKLELRDVQESAEWKRLVPLLRETAVAPLKSSYDNRTAVLLFDKNGRRVASMYFDGSGTRGTINGESGEISGGVYRWAKSLLKGVTE